MQFLAENYCSYLTEKNCSGFFGTSHCSGQLNGCWIVMLVVNCEIKQERGLRVITTRRFRLDKHRLLPYTNMLLPNIRSEYYVAFIYVNDVESYVICPDGSLCVMEN